MTENEEAEIAVRYLNKNGCTPVKWERLMAIEAFEAKQMADATELGINYMREAHCRVCGKIVAKGDQEEHLRSSHLGPHYFWFNMKKYRTEKPSMTIAEIKTLVSASVLYPCFQSNPHGGDFAWSDSESVDLTQEPHFYTVPPATPLQAAYPS